MASLYPEGNYIIYNDGTTDFPFSMTKSTYREDADRILIYPTGKISPQTFNVSIQKSPLPSIFSNKAGTTTYGTAGEIISFLRKHTRFFFDSITPEYLIEVRRGNVDNASLIFISGENESIGTTFTPITTSGTWFTPTALTTLEILSDDNTNDIAAGAGARKVIVPGITTNYEYIEQEVTLNGTTPVTIGVDFYRTFEPYISESGSYASQTVPSHNSTITIREVATPANIWAKIASDSGFGLGMSEVGCYTIRAGYTGCILCPQVQVEGHKAASVFLFKRPQIDVISAPYGVMKQIKYNRNLQDGIQHSELIPIDILEEKTDVGFVGKSTTGTTSVSVNFYLLLIKN